MREADAKVDEGEAMSEESVRRTDVLEIVAKAVALTAALLPAMGILVRFVSFRAAGVAGDQWSLAWSASLSQLVVTACFALLPLVVPLTVVAVFWRPLVLRAGVPQLGRVIHADAERLRTDLERLRIGAEDATAAGDQAVASDSHQASLETLERFADDLVLQTNQYRQLLDEASTHRWITRLRGPAWAYILIIPILILAVMSLGGFWYAIMVVLAAVILLTTTYRVGRRDPYVTFSRIWPAVLLTLLIAAIAGGLDGYLPGVTPGRYSFQGGTGAMADGKFQSIAQADGLFYLERCEPHRRELVAVQQGAIVTVRPRPESPATRRGPSLWDILLNGDPFPLGLRRC